MIALQKMIETKYSKKNIGDVVRAEIDEHSGIIQDMFLKINKYRYGEYGYKSKVIRVLELEPSSLEIAIELAVLVLPIREVSPIQTIVGLLGSQLGYDNTLDGVKTAADILAVCESSGLYEIYHNTDYENDTGTLGIKPKYEISEPVKNFILDTKYLPPMLCKPRNWTERNKGGYLYGSGSMLLKHINQNHEEQCLES